MNFSGLAVGEQEFKLSLVKLSKVIAFALSILFAGALTSCNTFLGVGRDLQQAGEGIEKTVNRQ